MEEAKKPVSWGLRMTMLADEHPDKVALYFLPVDGGAHRAVAWRELETSANRVARWMRDLGVNENSSVGIGLWNCVEHFFATIAAWKLGALVLPLRGEMPAIERDAMLDLLNPTLVVSHWTAVSYPNFTPEVMLAESADLDESPLPDVVAHPGKSIGSGGATGRSKIIVFPGRWELVPGERELVGTFIGFRPGQVQLIAGPLYHNSPFSFSHIGLFEDNTLVVMEKFDAAGAVDAIEEYGVQFCFMAPTMMQRIVRLEGVAERDFSSFEGMLHTAAPCPAWLKREWMKLLGPEKVYEAFGSTEAVGATVIRGDEWLEHPGSLGRPSGCDLRILDADGNEAAIGEVGEIYMRPHDKDETYYYIGSDPAKTTPDGFVSVGDMGWLDTDGFLFLADRRVDLIISGGANVFPAEVEAALTEHRDVYDAVVLGIPDGEWGKRVHAVIQAVDTRRPPSVAALDAFCRERLMSYKAPKTYEYVDEMPRMASGKVRRTLMVRERSDGADAQMIWVKPPNLK